MTERKERSDAAVLVSAVAHEQSFSIPELTVLPGKVVVGRGVAELFRDGGRQPAAGIGISEQDIDNGARHLLASEPTLEHRGHFVDPRKVHRRPCIYDNDGPRVRP